MRYALITGLVASVSASCTPSTSPADEAAADRGVPVASRPTHARSSSNEYISWREHIVDDQAVGGVAIAGSDGLAMADLDRDGHADVVSVHESDTEYDGVADGHVRLAFGSGDPDTWVLATLGEGSEVGAAEDVAIGDLNGDGYPDIVVACELAHLIYFQSPGPLARTARWARLIPTLASGRGSFIRAFLADLNNDGRPEVVAANKGAQNPGPDDREPRALSVFQVVGDPLEDGSWREHVLGRVAVPINAQPVDLDRDGDIDVVGGSRNERRILWFENQSSGELRFVEHAIGIEPGTQAAELHAGGPAASAGPVVTGFNMEFGDLSGDGRLDIVPAETGNNRLVWLEQPAQATQPWPLHVIGSVAPDAVTGIALADVDGDGAVDDVLVGGYSRGPRDADGDVDLAESLGRLAWFERVDPPGAAWRRHDISRRKRGMFDKFVAVDMDNDGDIDFVGTRGNSLPYDGVFWLEQVRTPEPAPAFQRARPEDSEEMALPDEP